MNQTKIKKIRESKQLLQKDVANKLHISRSIYALYETNERIVPLEKLKNLCNYFEVSMDYIFELDKENNYTYINDLNKKLIGNNIKTLREKEKISQRELAKYLNTTHSTISAYETGKTLILTSFLYQICKKYNLSMDAICTKKLH